METACLPSVIAYKVRPQQVPRVHKALLEYIPSLGHAPCDVIQHMGRSTRYDTQVLFATRDCVETPMPHEAVLFSFGRGQKIQIYRADAPRGEEESWYGWAEATAEMLGLQKIELPHAIFREDLSWMLRAHASRKSTGIGIDQATLTIATGASGSQEEEHMGDTHLIHRVERFFAEVVFLFRRQAWVQNSMPGISVRSMKQL